LKIYFDIGEIEGQRLFYKKIVAKLNKEMEALEGVWCLRQEIERRIEKIIKEVRGEVEEVR